MKLGGEGGLDLGVDALALELGVVELDLNELPTFISTSTSTGKGETS